MALQAIAFYLMAAVTVTAGFCVVSARNPVASLRPAQVAADFDALLQGLTPRGGRHGSPAPA